MGHPVNATALFEVEPEVTAPIAVKIVREAVTEARILTEVGFVAVHVTRGAAAFPLRVRWIQVVEYVCFHALLVTDNGHNLQLTL